jgi:hypothetical protein
MIQEYYILVNRIDSSTTLRFAQNDKGVIFWNVKRLKGIKNCDQNWKLRITTWQSQSSP